MDDKTRTKIRIFLVQRGILALCVAATVFVVPLWVCMRGSDRWYRGDKKVQQELASGVERWVRSGEQVLSADKFRTGSSLYNAEWLFGTYFAAGMGFGQTALEHPEWKESHAALMAQCLDNLLSERVSAFDTDAWNGRPALDDLQDGIAGHAAYLGHMNLLMSLHRLVDPNSQYARLNDRITSGLIRSVSNSPLGLIASYPGEFYPVDNCAVVGSIGLHGRATGEDHSVFVSRWTENLRKRYVDAKTGLLIQAVNPARGEAVDFPRGSGTAFGGYMIWFADPELSARLFAAVKRELAGGFFRFGAIREYPRGVAGLGDVDSGPVVLGYSVAATGFSAGLCRMHGDRSLYRRIYATAQLIGCPVKRGSRKNYVLGGSLGDAILFAMLTAPRGENP